MKSMARSEIETRFDRYRPVVDEEEWSSMIDAFTRPLPSTFWTHPTRVSSEWVADRFVKDGHPLSALSYAPGGYGAPTPMKWGRRFEFRAGLIHLQEASSMLPPIALDPKPGERVLDLCAAPGGKSAQLSLMMQNRGTLVVNDLSFARLRALRATQERLGLRNMVLCAQEGQQLLKDHPPCFDKVLVDAPCSCEGTLRKRGKWTYEPDEGLFKRRLVSTQKALLLQALRLTRSGGRVVYSTCTLDPDENEGVVNSVLEEWSRLRATGEVSVDVDVEPIFFEGLKSAPGLTFWEGQKLSDALIHALRVYPHHNDSGGFFLISLRLGQRTEAERSQAIQALESWARPRLCPQDEKREALRWVEDRFGIEEDQWGAVEFTEANSRYLSTVSEDLILPPTRYQVAGLPSLYIRGAVPRLTSAASLEWGGFATRSVIELPSEESVDLYYSRVDQTLESLALLRDDVQRGVYIVRYQERPLGLSYLSDQEGGRGMTLSSEYPKRIQLAEGHSAFEGPSLAERSWEERS